MHAYEIYSKVLQRIKTDPVFFIENLLTVTDKQGKIVPFKLNVAQQKIMACFLEQLHNEPQVKIVVLKARQQGISTLCKALSLWYAFVHIGTNVITVAQRQADLIEKVFPFVKTAAMEVGKFFPFITVKPTTSSLEIGISGKTSGITGAWAKTEGDNRGGTYNFIHLTEVEVYEKWEAFWVGLSQSLPSKNSVLLIESTSSGHGVMWDLYSQGVMKVVFVPWYIQPEYRLEGATPPLLTAEQKEIQATYNLSDDQMRWYAEKEKELGSHVAMQHEYPSCIEDCFSVEKDFSFFGFNLLEKASSRTVSDNSKFNIYLGIDPSRSRDHTGMVWRQGLSVTKILNLPPIENIEELASRIAAELENCPADGIFIDIGNGFGALCDILGSHFNIYARGVGFGCAADDRERHLNKRAEMYARAKKWLEGGGCIPRDREFLRQLNEIKFVPSNKLQLMDKARLAKSPDIADAFVLTFSCDDGFTASDYCWENKTISVDDGDSIALYNADRFYSAHLASDILK